MGPGAYAADNHLSMPHINLNSFGVLVEVEVHDESLQPAIEEMLPPGWTQSDAFPEDGHFTLSGTQDGEYGVLAEGQELGNGLDVDVAMHVLDAALRMRIAMNSRERIFVHAGVVALGDRALLLPGASFTGKTTLVAALVAAGATYFSDEYALLDEAGSVHPYPRHLSMRHDGGTPRMEHTAVEDLGGTAGTRPARPALIAVTEYKPQARWQPEPRSAGFGALALLTNTVIANDQPAISMRAVSRAVADAVILDGARGEAPETAIAMLEALARWTLKPLRPRRSARRAAGRPASS